MLSVPVKQPRGKNHSFRSMERINQKILKKPKTNKQKKKKIQKISNVSRHSDRKNTAEATEADSFDFFRCYTYTILMLFKLYLMLFNAI